MALIETALDNQQYKQLIGSSPVLSLRRCTLLLLETIDQHSQPNNSSDEAADNRHYRESYTDAIATLSRAGVSVQPRNVEQYVTARREWDPRFLRLALKLGYAMMKLTVATLNPLTLNPHLQSRLVNKYDRSRSHENAHQRLLQTMKLGWCLAREDANKRIDVGPAGASRQQGCNARGVGTMQLVCVGVFAKMAMSLAKLINDPGTCARADRENGHGAIPSHFLSSSSVLSNSRNSRSSSSAKK